MNDREPYEKKKKRLCRNIHEVCAILVARCGSSRRPEKVLADIGGINVLELIVHRLKISPHIKQIIVATTDDEKDDRIEKLTKQLKIDCFRGDKEDIVSRMHKASRLTNCELILEVGGDCPLVDAELIDVGLSHYEMSDADFTSNAFFAPFTYPVGYDFSLIKKEALSFIYENATLKSQRFQPFEFVVKNKDQFTTCHFSLGTNLNHWRWTVTSKKT